MIIQADKVPEFGDVYNILSGPIEFKLGEIVVDREGFRLRFKGRHSFGTFRRWSQHKNLHEVIKSRFPEALL